MTVFRINLIRDRPVPLPQRKSVALPVLIYLCAVGLLLAWSINRAVRNVLAVRQRQQQAAAEELLFAQQHPRQLDAASYIGALRHQLTEAASTLGVAEQLLECRIPTAAILYELTTPLPRNVRLLSMELTPSDHALHVDLAIPVEPEGSSVETIKPLAIWHKSPAIQKLLSDIREESNRQAEFEGRPSFLVRFSATINQEGH